MDKLFSGIAFIIMLPIALVIIWLVGMAFREGALKENLEKGNKFVQLIITLVVGILIIILFMKITGIMGCSKGEDNNFRP